ncbi:TPA: hypothetical protein ACH3X1_003955 [Trebouxia sp. C0004]
MLARWLYIQAFEDGKQAAQVEHNLVMRAIVDTHNAQLDIAFKHGQDYKAMASEAPELEPHEHAEVADSFQEPTSQQQKLLQMCLDVTDIHHIDYDP